MLVIGRALMSDPKVILLDEPSLGLAPMIIEEIFGVIRRLKEEQKITVLLVEQNAALALDIADHGYVMENGRIVLEGPAEACGRTPTSRNSILASTRPARANPTARPRTTAAANAGCPRRPRPCIFARPKQGLKMASAAAATRFEVIFETEGHNPAKFRNDIVVHKRPPIPSRLSFRPTKGRDTAARAAHRIRWRISPAGSPPA